MERPLITEYLEISTYVSAMVHYRKSEDPDFSVARACRGRYRCSPVLISHIMSGKRRLTPDRVQDIAVILDLTARERAYLRQWVLPEGPAAQQDSESRSQPASGKRRQVSAFILRDWLHVYVKDSVRLASVQKDPQSIYRELGGIASQQRIDRSLRFLLHHGYLKRNQEGVLVESEPLHVTGDKDANRKVRAFHAKALDIARDGLELYSTEERLAQALVLPLDGQAYAELSDLIRQFSEQLKVFAEQHASSDQRLYQIVLHLTPTGGTRAK